MFPQRKKYGAAYAAPYYWIQLLSDQSAAGGVLLIDLSKLLFAVDIGLVNGLDPAAAGVAAAIAAVAASAAGAQRPADDLLPLLTGGVADQQRPHVGRLLSSRHVQHVFHENAVAPRGVVNENVGHSPHQLAVLQDGAAAHG